MESVKMTALSCKTFTLDYIAELETWYNGFSGAVCIQKHLCKSDFPVVSLFKWSHSPFLAFYVHTHYQPEGISVKV